MGMIKIFRICKGYKKGVFFTFISLSLMAMMLILASTGSYTNVEGKISADALRISQLNSYIDDLEKGYLERALYTSSYKAITSIVLYANETKSFLDEEGDFSEVIINGTIGGVKIDSITNKKIMENNTLSNWTEKIKDSAKIALKADTRFTINKVDVSQNQPWYMEVELNISYTVNTTTASWEREDVIVHTQLDITNFYDPYYLVNTDNLQQVKKSSIPYNKWNISNLKQHIADRTYTHFEDGTAPSFLMRFFNDTSASTCCGIESAVNLTVDASESYIDYQFWNNTYADNCGELYNITTIWDDYPWFKLDIEHVTHYNVSGTKSC